MIPDWILIMIAGFACGVLMLIVVSVWLSPPDDDG
jgi:uncharacterized membrane protein YedE/YeeE